MALVISLVAGCSSMETKPGIQRVTFDQIKPPPPGPIEAAPYRLRKADVISINFAYNPELNIANQVIRPDGKMALPLVGEITAEGLTLQEIKTAISSRYRDFIARTDYSERLKEGDDIQIRFLYNPEFNQSLAIRPDGKISMPIIGDVQAAGVRPADLRKHLIAEYSKHIKRPDVTVLMGGNVTKKIFADDTFITVSLSKPANQEIFVGGEVQTPKTVRFAAKLTTLQAIMEAGGVKDSGDLSRIVVLRRGQYEQGEWIQTDLSQPLLGKNIQNDVELKSGDIVIVPKSGIARVDLFIKQYIRDLLPVETFVDFNFTHSF